MEKFWQTNGTILIEISLLKIFCKPNGLYAMAVYIEACTRMPV